MGMEKRMCQNTTEPESPRLPAVPSDAKVYKLQYPEGKEMARIVAALVRRQVMVVRIRVLALLVPLVGLASILLDFGRAYMIPAGVGLAVGLAILELAWHGMVKRQVRRQVPILSGKETTLTISDSGLVLENDRASVYYAWHLLSKPHWDRKLGFLNIVAPTGGRGIPLHGLDDARREEVFSEIQARVGKQGGTVPPPLDATHAHPLKFTYAQRREAYDILATRISRPWLAILGLLAMPVLSWWLCKDLGYFVWSGGEMERGQLFLFIFLVYLVYRLGSTLLHPGGKLLRALSTGKALQMRPTAYLFDEEQRLVLVLAGENYWVTGGFEDIEAVARGKSCRLLVSRGADSGIALPLDAELPPGLPAEKPARRRSRLAIPAILLSILACIGALVLANFDSRGTAVDREYPCPAEVMYDEVAAPILYPEFWRPAIGK